MKIKIKDIASFKRKLIVSGYSQRSFGRALGISEPYANQIANGTRNPGPEIAKNISKLLKVDFDDIFFIEFDSKSNQKVACNQ